VSIDKAIARGSVEREGRDRVRGMRRIQAASPADAIGEDAHRAAPIRVRPVMGCSFLEDGWPGTTCNAPHARDMASVTTDPVGNLEETR
jgi:hypothetical protein